MEISHCCDVWRADLAPAERVQHKCAAHAHAHQDADADPDIDRNCSAKARPASDGYASALGDRGEFAAPSIGCAPVPTPTATELPAAPAMIAPSLRGGGWDMEDGFYVWPSPNENFGGFVANG